MNAMSRTGKDLVGSIVVYQEKVYVVYGYNDDILEDDYGKYLLVFEADDDAQGMWVERSAFIVPDDDVTVVKNNQQPLFTKGERVYIPSMQAHGIIMDSMLHDHDDIHLYDVKVGNDTVNLHENAITRDVLPKLSITQKLALIEQYFMGVIEEAEQEENVSNLALSISASGYPHSAAAFELKFTATVNFNETATTNDLFRSFRIANLRRAENEANKPRLLPKM
jgi:hypothetical protein